MHGSIPERYNEERVFIREIWFEPSDLAARLIYADWLEEHRDGRAEILRSDVQFLELDARLTAVRQDLETTASTDEHQRLEEQRQALMRQRRKLIRPDHVEWVALVGSAPIEYCLSRDQPERMNLRFKVRCPMRWENLQSIGDDPHVRYCTECERVVHYCFSRVRAFERARWGDCVALDPTLADTNLTDPLTYNPQEEMLGELI